MDELNCHKILDTCPNREEADRLLGEWEEQVAELGFGEGWRVYIKPYKLPHKRYWWYAICVGPQEA